MREQPETSVGGLRNLVHAEEAAHGRGAVLVVDVTGEQHEGDDGGERERSAPEQHAADEQGGEDRLKLLFADVGREPDKQHQGQRGDRNRAEQEVAVVTLTRQ